MTTFCSHTDTYIIIYIVQYPESNFSLYFHLLCNERRSSRLHVEEKVSAMRKKESVFITERR